MVFSSFIETEIYSSSYVYPIKEDLYRIPGYFPMSLSMLIPSCIKTNAIIRGYSSCILFDHHLHMIELINRNHLQLTNSSFISLTQEYTYNHSR